MSGNFEHYTVSGIPIRILTVDDEPVIVEEIVDLLTLHSIDATGLSDPSDALGILAANPGITVLMTDLDMPAINGLELAERALSARSEENALEVIVLTAHPDLDATINSMRIGVFDLLRKPAPIVTMKDTLERAHRKAVERRRRYQASLVTTNKPPIDLDVIDTTMVIAATAGGKQLEISGGGSFLSAINRGLDTPLDPVNGFPQLIEKQSSLLNTGELKEYARYIREAGESLFELAESVINVTESRARSPIAKLNWVQPTEILE